MTNATTPHAPGVPGRRPKTSPETIIPVAWALFEARGFDETTMSDVASAVGVSRRTLFNYFESKEAMLFPAVDEYMVAFADRLETRPRDEPLFQSLQICLDACQSLRAEIEQRFGPGPIVIAARLDEPAVRYSRDYWSREMTRIVAHRLADRVDGDIVAGFVGVIAAQVWTETTKRLREAGAGASIDDALADVMSSFVSLFR